MQAALQENLPTAELDGLLNFGEECGFVENVSVGIVFVSAKGAKLASAYANIGVIDVSLDVICPYLAGMETFRNRIGIGTERRQVAGM
jgi:hypothetical protein